MKKFAFPLIGLVGMASFILQFEYLLVACESMCLAGFVWLLFSKKISIRSLPLLTATLALGILVFNQGAVASVVDRIWPRVPAWCPSAPEQEELPWIARCLMYRPFTWFYRIADALTGLCLAGILLPWFKHLSKKHSATTSVVMAGLLLLWLAFISFKLEISDGMLIGSPLAFYCATMMAIDLLSGKKSKAFYIVFLSVLTFSLLLTLLVALVYHKYPYYGDIYFVFEWLIAYTAPLCSALFYIVWAFKNNR